ESSLSALKEALAGTDVEAIKTATESLLTASQGFSQRLYEEASRENAAGATATDGGPADEISDDEVVDAEIVDPEPDAPKS
ncbi:MAG TPA: molecular chaperone DnaK, partial [Acidimicrobiales bacterium]|nr:molecular chaperone DnaK [Acidimicrobiales bacterium]